MSGQWTWYLCNYPGAQGALTPTIQDVAAPPIFMSPYSSGLTQALTQNKHIFLLHAHHQIRGSMLLMSPGVSTLSHYHPRQHTQRNIHFMERPNTSQKLLLSLFPGSQGITFGSYNPKKKMSNDWKTPLHLKSPPPPPPLLRSTLQPHTRWQRNVSGRVPGLWEQMQEGATLTRASTVCTGHELFRPPTLLIHVRAPQAEVAVVIGNDCPIRSFLGCRNIFLKIQF